MAFGVEDKIYVRFGKGPTDEMPKEWAEKILTNLRDKDPARFGKLLAEVVTSGRQQ